MASGELPGTLGHSNAIWLSWSLFDWRQYPWPPMAIRHSRPFFVHLAFTFTFLLPFWGFYIPKCFRFILGIFRVDLLFSAIVFLPLFLMWPLATTATKTEEDPYRKYQMLPDWRLAL